MTASSSKAPMHCIRNLSLLLMASLLAAGDAPAPASVQDDGRYAMPEQAPAFRDPVFISLPLTRAYPGTEFNMRPAVTGGTWPYRFTLRTAPKGMAIDARTGTITWQAPQADGTVQVVVDLVDQAGKKADQAFPVTIGKAGFYFVSPDGDDANPGSFEKPWKTVIRAAQPVADPAQATLYLRGGTYPVVTQPAKPGEKKCNTLGILRTSPRHWMAWPGEQPVIDLGWSEAQWKAALEVEKAAVAAKQAEVATTQGYGRRIFIDQETDGLLFDGLEVKNAAYYMFVMWHGDRSNLTWRRCNLHHLYGDYRENPSFIFTFAAERSWPKAAPGEDFAFGKRPQTKPYRHLIVQECAITDRPYWDARDGVIHGGGLVWYTTQGCLVEDSRFERIERGHAIIDKDNGWDNTYRNNVFRGNVMLAAQGCDDGIVMHHNYFDGELHIGAQPGWLRNIWIHHNAIHGRLSTMGGQTAGPRIANALEGKKPVGPADPEWQAMLRDFPKDQRLVFCYGNVVAAPVKSPDEKDAFLYRVNPTAEFAAKQRFVFWDRNLVDDTTRVAVGWSRTFMNWSELKPCGIDAEGASGAVVLDAEGRLPADSPWRATYGRDAGTGLPKP
jgi:hypothetical protein